MSSTGPGRGSTVGASGERSLLATGRRFYPCGLAEKDLRSFGGRQLGRAHDVDRAPAKAQQAKRNRERDRAVAVDEVPVVEVDVHEGGQAGEALVSGAG